MGKQALEAPRGQFFMIYPEDLILITNPTHRLYDKRVSKPITEQFIRNIDKFGVKKLIEVRKNGKNDDGSDRLEVVEGRRRQRAAVEANRWRKAEGRELMRVPVIIVKGDDAEMDALMVLGNENREDDDLLTRAEKAQRLIDQFGIEHAALIFGKEVQTIQKWLQLLDLADDVKAKIRAGEITPSAALPLVDLAREEQAAVLASLPTNGAASPSGTAVKAAVQRKANPKQAAATKRHVEARKNLIDVAWSYANGKATLNDLKDSAREYGEARETAQAKKKAST